MSDRPRARQCPRCQAPVLAALVGNPCGLNVRADPYPLSLAQELAARLDGRFSYCLRLHPFLPPRLITRGPEHIASGRCAHLVVADHHCTGTAPAALSTELDSLF
ncbi:hypothetical protein [Streptomyces syringium]|uniref:hypothetical protein n=1 Tax=Streptomyces syringium TaxID=76729 RepID=UPI003AAAC21F